MPRSNVFHRNIYADYPQAASLIAHADALLICAGAGMGVDSGLPDFRGVHGFWEAYPALERARLDFVDIASPQRFDTDPTLAWGFYGHRLNLYRTTKPHAGFEILRRWAERMAFGARVFTSNVDEQFQKAGFDASCINECHGTIHALQCTRPCTPDIWPAEGFLPLVDEASCRLLNELPLCPHCGAVARPNILMFNDSRWVFTVATDQRQREDAWLEMVASNSARLLVIELGAGQEINTVRRHSETICQKYGAKLIRINPRNPWPPSGMGLGFAEPAAQALQRIQSRLTHK